MDLLLTAALPWPTVLFVILVDEVMIVTGLIGALVKTSYKWVCVTASSYCACNLPQRGRSMN